MHGLVPTTVAGGRHGLDPSSYTAKDWSSSAKALRASLQPGLLTTIAPSRTWHPCERRLLSQVLHAYRRRIETRPKEPDVASHLGMCAHEASQAIDQDICTAINRDHGLAILVLEWVRRVT